MHISDLLEIPSFSGARFISGQKGGRNIIHAVGVIDLFNLIDANLSHISKYSNLNNKLLLSITFLSYPAEIQKKYISFLSSERVCGLVIYTTDMLPGKLSAEAIAMSNELNFPIILLQNNFISYSHVIWEIMQILIVSPMLFGTITEELEKHSDNPSIETLLNLIQTHFHLEVALFDWNFQMVYPTLSAGIPSITNIGKFLYLRPKGETMCTIEDTSVFYRFSRMLKPNNTCAYFAILSPIHPISDSIYQQVMAILHFFFTKYYKTEQRQNMLAQCLLSNDYQRAKQIAEHLGFDVKQLKNLVICTSSSSLPWEQIELSSAFDHFFYKKNIEVYSFPFDAGIAFFLKDNAETQETHTYAKELCEMIKESFNINTVMFCFRISTINKAHTYFEEFRAHSDAIKRIFPLVKVFDNRRFTLACGISSISKQAPSSLKYFMDILTHLLKASDLQREFLETLQVFFLDADSNIEAAAKLLYLHKNTVKYRLQRASDILGFDIRRSPENFQLYMAIALHRLNL